MNSPYLHSTITHEIPEALRDELEIENSSDISSYQKFLFEYFTVLIENDENLIDGDVSKSQQIRRDGKAKSFQYLDHYQTYLESQKLLVTRDPFDSLLEKTTKNYLEFASLHKHPSFRKQNGNPELIQTVKKCYPSIEDFLAFFLLNADVDDDTVVSDVASDITVEGHSSHHHSLDHCRLIV